MAAKKVEDKVESVDTPVEAAVEAATKAVEDMKMMDFSSMTETYRKMAEENMAKMEEGMTKVKTMSDETAKAFEDSFEVAKVDGTKLSLKTMDLFYSNISTSMSHFEKLMGLKSVADMMELQSTFMQSQFDALGVQMKELQDAGMKLSESVVAPVKAITEKNMAEMKLA